MENPDTYYERVPVAEVKRIAKVDPVEEPEDEAEIAALPASASDAWEELARQAQRETDPTKMIDLVQQLIAKYDEGRMPGGRVLAAKRRVMKPGP